MMSDEDSLYVYLTLRVEIVGRIGAVTWNFVHNHAYRCYASQYLIAWCNSLASCVREIQSIGKAAIDFRF